MMTGIYCINAYVSEGEVQGKKYSKVVLTCLLHEKKAGGNKLLAHVYEGKTEEVTITGPGGDQKITDIQGHEVMLQVETKVFDGKTKEYLKCVMVLPVGMGSNIDVFIDGEEV